MKLEYHPKLSSMWVKWGFVEQKQGREHPNMRQEQFCKEAVILKVVELRDRTGVMIDVKHPEYVTEQLTGNIIVRDKQLAGNLLQTTQEFLGKTIEELGEAEVTDEMLLTS